MHSTCVRMKAREFPAARQEAARGFDRRFDRKAERADRARNEETRFSAPILSRFRARGNERASLRARLLDRIFIDRAGRSGFSDATFAIIARSQPSWLLFFGCFDLCSFSVSRREKLDSLIWMACDPTLSVYRERCSRSTWRKQIENRSKRGQENKRPKKINVKQNKTRFNIYKIL